MAFTISEEPIATLVEQADVPMIFTYMSILEPTIVAGGLGGFLLTEKPLEAPRSKDYDAVENDRPADWVRRFDVTNWGFIVARSPEGKSDGISEDSSAAKSEVKSANKSTGRRIGGAVIAFNSPDAEMLERRKDLAVLWDLRVHPIFAASASEPLYLALPKIGRVNEAVYSSKSKPRTIMSPPASFTHSRAARSAPSTALHIPTCPTKYK